MAGLCDGKFQGFRGSLSEKPVDSHGFAWIFINFHGFS